MHYVLPFDGIDHTQIALVGGKAANLGELSRIEGIRVPPGFCITTEAFRRIMAEAPSIDGLLEQFSRLTADEHEAIAALSAEIRRTIESISIPDDIATAITHAHAQLGENAAYAVRSSATAEDLPAMSFAGQQDSYLNISGTAAILQHVSRCWASPFTERAITYRLRNGIGHERVLMAVIVQRMVVAEAAGVLFTADPLTGNRKLMSIEATPGLGEALVSGLVNADVFTVHDGEIVKTSRQDELTLTDAQVLRLAQLGRQIEAHFGRPQDIEWCLAGDEFQFVQSRPITTLFPIPVASDGERHVYVSVGHGQMMTDAMKPLGISMWQMTAATRMYEAGGRLFVDITRALGSSAGRTGLLGMLGKGDPLIGDALETLIQREFIPLDADAESVAAAAKTSTAPAAPIDTDAGIVAELIASGQASITKLKDDSRTMSGSALFDFIVADLQELKRIAFNPRSTQAIMAGMEAAWWLNDHIDAWIGEKNAADALTQSVPNNITSEMGLELLDVADVIRPHPVAVDFLQHVGDDDFINILPGIPGGIDAREALLAWLGKYGMRCPGEIDITRPRWSEHPSALLPLILSNVRNFEPGAGTRRFEEGQRAARTRADELLARVRTLPDGDRKAAEVEAMMDRLRTFIGYREYPKYFIINRHFAYKQALMREAARLEQAGVLRDRDDIFFLAFEELRDVVRANEVDYRLIDARKRAFTAHEALTPPRVLTSDGEIVSGSYQRRDAPAGALVGLPVSAGTIEGRARVILDVAQADLEPGDILVTTFTDPSWTPLFVAIKGLVTEVGGLMTHGAVIAREYGLPAVVGVERATRLIRDGQRIRVHGTDGYVELLS
jgi:pyruvate,water dikinase